MNSQFLTVAWQERILAYVRYIISMRGTMGLLKDDELKSEVDNESCVLGLELPEDWLGKNSPIQPASIDLTVGAIYLPGAEDGAPGHRRNPLSKHSLEPG